MQAVYMPYRPKMSKRKRSDSDIVTGSPLVTLRKVNTFSEPPLTGNVTKAVAYSRGKLSDCPALKIFDD